MVVLVLLMEESAEPDMPTYEFGCEHCGEVFDHIYQSVPKKMPKTRKCVSCGKKAPRLISAGNFHMKGIQYRVGKTEVNTFYNEAIRDSRERLDVDKAHSPYKRYKPNVDSLVKTGEARRLSESEIKQRSAQTKKIGENIVNIGTKLAKNKKK